MDWLVGVARKYTHERKTRNLGVVYYVREDFSSSRDGTSLNQIERHVEEDYIIDLQHSCYRERNNSKCHTVDTWELNDVLAEWK